MDTLLSYIPSGEQGLMPYYLFLVSLFFAKTTVR